MVVTREHIRAIAPTVSDELAEVFVPLLNEYQGECNTRLRMAAFLAQALHESGGFKWLHELASGDEYEGRTDLGNTVAGEGRKFKGRGLLQITGRYNYQKVSEALYGNINQLLETPELLAEPVGAVRSAFWFWEAHQLNELADKKEIETITRRINGGLNGIQERRWYYTLALKSLTPDPVRQAHDDNGEGFIV